MLAWQNSLQLGRATDGGPGEHVSPTVKILSTALSHKAGRRRGALTLQHLLQLRLAADCGAAGRRAGCPHSNCSGHIITARSTAAGRDEVFAVPAHRQQQVSCVQACMHTVKGLPCSTHATSSSEHIVDAAQKYSKDVGFHASLTITAWHVCHQQNRNPMRPLQAGAICIMP